MHWIFEYVALQAQSEHRLNKTTPNQDSVSSAQLLSELPFLLSVTVFVIIFGNCTVWIKHLTLKYANIVFLIRLLKVNHLSSSVWTTVGELFSFSVFRSTLWTSGLSLPFELWCLSPVQHSALILKHTGTHRLQFLDFSRLFPLEYGPREGK